MWMFLILKRILCLWDFSECIVCCPVKRPQQRVYLKESFYLHFSGLMNSSFCLWFPAGTRGSYKASAAVLLTSRRCPLAYVCSSLLRSIIDRRTVRPPAFPSHKSSYVSWLVCSEAGWATTQMSTSTQTSWSHYEAIAHTFRVSKMLC